MQAGGSTLRSVLGYGQVGPRGHILTLPLPSDWALLQIRAQLQHPAVQIFFPPSSPSSSSCCPGNQRPRRLAPGDSPVTKAAFTVPAGWGHPCAPSSPHNAGWRVLGVACHPGGMAGGSQTPRVLPSSSSSTGQGTGFTGSPGQWGGGGRRRGQGLFLVALAGWRPGQPSLKPLAHPGGSPSVIQPEGSCPSKPGEAVGIPAGQEVGPVPAKQLALLLFSHPALPNPRNSLL